MPSVAAYESLLGQGIPVNKSPYCRYDNLCSAEDIRLLFDVLQQHQDGQGNHPIITANVVVANPDFEKSRLRFQPLFLRNHRCHFQTEFCP
jgi:hypothetical protein